MSRELRALTLIEVLVLIVCAAIVLLVALFLPAVRRSKSGRTRVGTVCAANLKDIGIAFRTWETDYGNRYPMNVPVSKGGTMEWGDNVFKHFQVMSNELNDLIILVCPKDDRIMTTNFSTLSNSNLSYFVGLDADESRPTMILAGDRNLVTNGVTVVPGLIVLGANPAIGWSDKMHHRAGNILFADGSVGKATSAQLPVLFQKTGTNINRLAVP